MGWAAGGGQGESRSGTAVRLLQPARRRPALLPAHKDNACLPQSMCKHPEASEVGALTVHGASCPPTSCPPPPHRSLGEDLSLLGDADDELVCDLQAKLAAAKAKVEDDAVHILHLTTQLEQRSLAAERQMCAARHGWCVCACTCVCVC